MKNSSQSSQGGPLLLDIGNIVAAGWCTVFISIIGFLMLLAGAIVTGIAYTEIRPNFADENYERYIGANFERIVGPVLLCFGLLLLLGSCGFFGCAFLSASYDYNDDESSYEKNEKDAEEGYA